MELRNLPEYKELLELKRLKKQTLQEIQGDKVGMQHIGYKVNICTFMYNTKHFSQAFTYTCVFDEWRPMNLRPD